MVESRMIFRTVLQSVVYHRVRCVRSQDRRRYLITSVLIGNARAASEPHYRRCCFYDSVVARTPFVKPTLVPCLYLSEPHSPFRGCAVGSPLVFISVGVTNYASHRNRQTTVSGRSRCAYAWGALFQHLHPHS